MLALREGTREVLNNVAVVTEVNHADGYLDEQERTHSEDNPCASRIPKVPEAREKVKEWLPESFDELSVRLNQKFDRLAVDVERMTKELREAQEQSDRLRHQWFNRRIF